MMRWIRSSSDTAVRCALGGLVAACGGGTTQPGPPPPPPPPPPPVGASLDLAPGEVVILSDVGSVRSFEIIGASEAREYQVIVVSASQVEGGVAAIRFVAAADAGAAAIAPQLPPSRAPGFAIASDPVSVESRGMGAPGSDVPRRRHLEIRAMLEREVARVGGHVSPKAARRGGAVPAVRASFAAAGVPQVGETVTITSPVVPGGGISCNAITHVSGVVRAVGQNFVIVEDASVAGHLTASDLALLEQELDEFVAPVDDDYFGRPGDLDGNGRVIAFFTGQVNRLSTPGSGSIVIGFFTPSDLLDPLECPASNEAEIIWLVAPDPDGDIGPPVTVALVKRIARGLVAHEYQHLLNAVQRSVIGGGDPIFDSEETWINEGMSHIAEEVSGFHRIGRGTRANLGFAEIGVGSPVLVDSYQDFHHGNLLNLSIYLDGPSGLVAVATGGVSFATRGWGYMFLRWLGDRYGPPSPVGVVAGSAENLLFRELAAGGATQMRGIPNVLRAINVVSGESPSWDDVVSEYVAATASDDAQVGGLPPEVQFSTWNYPRLFSELQANSVPGLSAGFPLRQSQVAMGSGARSTSVFDIGASTARYFRFTASGAHPGMRVDLTTPSGANVPNGVRARVVVVRTR